jgi:hypothetical protein
VEFEPRNSANNLLGLAPDALASIMPLDVFLLPEAEKLTAPSASVARQDSSSCSAVAQQDAVILDNSLVANSPMSDDVLGLSDETEPADTSSADLAQTPFDQTSLREALSGSLDDGAAWPLGGGPPSIVGAPADGPRFASPSSTQVAAHGPMAALGPATSGTAPATPTNAVNDRLAAAMLMNARTTQAPPPAPPAPAVSTVAPPTAKSAPDPKLFIPQNLSVNPGSTVTVPLQMLVTQQSGILVSEVDAAIAYDTSKFTVSNARLGSMLSPSIFDVTYFDTTSFPGEILLSAASSISQQGFANGAEGAVFLVDFTAKTTAASGPSPINLQAQFDEGGGLVQPTDVLDNNLNPLTLTPAPTNASNDPVDGIVAVNGTKTATSTSLSATPNPSTYGQSVTLTAVVTGAGGTPTGTVAFMDGSQKLGTATLINGKASFTTAKISAGSRSLTAVYGGDTNFAGSTSAAWSQTVNKAQTTNHLAVSPSSSVYGQAVTLTATVSAVAPGGGIPGGTVTFKNGGTTVGTATLNASGVATLQTTALPVGSDSLTAVWFGNSNYFGSTATAVTEVVAKDGSTVALSSSQNPSKHLQPVTFTAIVAAAGPGSGTPTGTVTFLNGGAVLGTATLSGGRCTFTTSGLPAGTDNITAVYAGDGHFLTHTSSPLAQVVQA